MGACFAVISRGGVPPVSKRAPFQDIAGKCCVVHSLTMEGAVRLLQIRYHPKFKSEDTLLFAGSRDDIGLLRSFFLGWNGDELDLIEYLQERVTVYLFSVSALLLRRDIERDRVIWSSDKGT